MRATLASFTASAALGLQTCQTANPSRVRCIACAGRAAHDAVLHGRTASSCLAERDPDPAGSSGSVAVAPCWPWCGRCPCNLLTGASAATNTGSVCCATVHLHKVCGNVLLQNIPAATPAHLYCYVPGVKCCQVVYGSLRVCRGLARAHASPTRQPYAAMRLAESAPIDKRREL